MKTNLTRTEQYSKKIIYIVCLTNIPAILFLPSVYDQAIGWITGTIASSLNFLWLSHSVKSIMGTEPNSSRLASYKRFNLRFIALAAYSVIVVLLLKPDILIYGAGLVSVQLTIYGHYIYELFKPKNVNNKDG